MLQTLIKYLLKKLAGITAEQWATAVNFVYHAATTKLQHTDGNAYSGDQKRLWVVEALKQAFPEMRNNAVLNLLVEAALAYLRHRAA